MTGQQKRFRQAGKAAQKILLRIPLSLHEPVCKQLREDVDVRKPNPFD
jgi:hypothetical protein